MELQFDIKKTLAAVAFLMDREGGQLDMFLGLKMLYIADKEALVRWGKTITGDSFWALPKGPALRTIYNLFKGEAPESYQVIWDDYFSEKMNHSIHLLRPVNVEVLSERETEVLESARQQINKFAPWEVSEWTHKTCPEWQDPRGSSFPIDPAVILKNAGRTDAEIEAIEEEDRTFNQTKKLLGVS